MSKIINARIATVNTLLRLRQQQGSLASELPQLSSLIVDEQEQRFAKELSYGLCRWYFFLEYQLKQLMSKPLKNKDHDIHLLLLLGLYQLQFTRVAPHAAINETVDAASFFRKPWAKKLINGVLRSFQRQQANDRKDGAELDPSQHLVNHKIAHPQWLQDRITHSWQQQAKAIFAANNAHPPFTLRVNQQHHTREEYLKQLLDAGISASAAPFSGSGIMLAQAMSVEQLPGFSDGHISVQDEAAQLSAQLLRLQPQQKVLDACCAPGGKTCHIGEREPQLAKLVALDLEERRLGRVKENLQRLQIDAQVICGDASQPDEWWDGEQYDRILVDAPCSATGVIRRHPDIKLLRTPTGVAETVMLQRRILESLWPLLAEEGILLYATCSILPEENTQLIEQFIADHKDAVHDVIPASWGIEQPYGRQLFPQQEGHDGFYYARLIKTKA